MAATRPTTVSLKLLIDKNSQRVPFAEAGKDFVDFLFNALSLPVSTIIRLPSKEGIVGCLGNLYDSIENWVATYMQSTEKRVSLLKPIVLNSSASIPLLLPYMQSLIYGNFYRCYNCKISINCATHVAYEPKSVCRNHKNVMDQNLTVVSPAVKVLSSEGGYVKGLVTYMIMDGLLARPLSTNSIVTLFNKFNAKNAGDVEEKVIDMGIDGAKGLKLLRASMHTREVLTAVFLGKEAK